MQLQSNETVYIPRVGVKRGTCKPVRSYLGQACDANFNFVSVDWGVKFYIDKYLII